jgi:hypothetical protein
MDLIPQDAIEFFTAKWSLYDPHAQGTISFEHVGKMIQQLPPPLGVGMRYNEIKILKALRTLPLHIWHGRVHYIDLLHVLAERVAGTE